MTRPNYAIALSTVLLAASCAADDIVDKDESQEPPLHYSLKVGEKSFPIREGETLQLDGTYSNPKVQLQAEEFRVFRFQKVSFKYPRHFTFEADLEDATSKSWTLSGNDFKIIVFSQAAKPSSRQFADNLIEQFGTANCRVVNANARIALGSHNLRGTSLKVKIASHQLAVDIYLIPTRGLDGRMLVIQDALDDAGKPSAEAAVAMKALQSSFSAEE